MGAAAEHRDAEEEAEIVPAAIVRHSVDRDIGQEQRADPCEREDEPVPQAVKKSQSIAASYYALRSLRGTGGEEQKEAYGGGGTQRAVHHRSFRVREARIQSRPRALEEEAERRLAMADARAIPFTTPCPQKLIRQR